MSTEGGGAALERSAVLVAGSVHMLADLKGPAVRAVLVQGERIRWVGHDPAEAPDDAAPRIDLGTACITPAFVDGHVHATATGLAASGLDLDGVSSAAECLDHLRRYASEHEDPVILGGPWDDFGWPEGGPPNAQELGDAAPGRIVLLTRVDAHSCLVDASTLAALPLEGLEGVDRDAHGEATGLLREQASQAALRYVRGRLGQDQRAKARLYTCTQAARLGIGCLHEMGHPGLSGLDDALAWATGDWPVDVLVWWAELDAEAGRAHGLRPGGDLFLDGSFGSHTAALTNPYCDAEGRGVLFYDDEDVAAFFVACTGQGRGAGVHAIGDRAIRQAVGAIEAAASRWGTDAVRRCRHRIEHVELPRRSHVEAMARLGVVASVQPAFDGRWGGDDGLYASRFGAHRAMRSNPLSWLVDAGVRLAFSSDTPVTPMAPWDAVWAAEQHRAGLGIDRYRAVHAHTVGGRYPAAQDDVGPLIPGNRADLAIWDADPFTIADPRELTCLATLVAGRTAYGDLAPLPGRTGGPP